MVKTMHTQWVLAYAIAAGDWLARTEPDGTVNTWRVLDANPDPRRLDHVLISGDAGHGVVVAHRSDWFRRVIQN